MSTTNMGYAPHDNSKLLWIMPDMIDVNENLRNELQGYIDASGLPLREFCRVTPVKYDTVRDFLRHKSQNISAAAVDIIRMRWRDGMQISEYEVETNRLIPAYDSIRIAAGRPSILSELMPEQTIFYRSRRPNLRAIKVDDNSFSMNRIAVPGQYIVVDFDITDPDELDGKLVVACVDGAATFKRWHRNPDRLVPESTQPDYDTTFIRNYEEFRIIGKVIDVVGDRNQFE